MIKQIQLKLVYKYRLTDEFAKENQAQKDSKKRNKKQTWSKKAYCWNETEALEIDKLGSRDCLNY